MAVEINGKPALLFPVDYDYLGDPVSLSAAKEHEDYVVTMEGGDAAGSYDVKWIFGWDLSFAQYVLKKRIVRAGEFPEDYESTDYVATRKSN